MEKFFYKKKLIGIRINEWKSGKQLISEPNEPLQAIALHQPAGTIVAPHRHTETIRTTNTLQECLVVIDGSVRVDLYADQTEPVEQTTLTSGDLFITISGGHSITFITDAKIFEIKNGPFKNDRIDI